VRHFHCTVIKTVRLLVCVKGALAYFGMASHDICNVVWEKGSYSLCTVINIARLLVCVKGALSYFGMASLTIFVTRSAIP